MKIKILAGLLLFTITLISCKNSENKEETATTEEVEPNTFDVTLDVIIKTDEELILFYKNGPNQWFEDTKTVWANVKGSEEVQPVVFNFPEGVLPTDLRIDIGRNEMKNLKTVEIKKLKISYLGKMFEIPQDKISIYFKPNKCMSFDATTNMYGFNKDKDGNYDPFLEAQPEFYKELAKVALMK